MRRRRAPRVAIVALLAVFVIAQVVRRPRLENPRAAPERGVQAHVHVPADVELVLRRACYDCHSNETRWPLYAHVAPASWLVARDVRRARADLNFSEWGTDPVTEPTPAQRLGGVCSDLRKAVMPPRSYLLLHPRARVTSAEVHRICEWTSTARSRLDR